MTDKPLPLAPMTWGEFKRKAEAEGLRDGDVISYIDWGGHAGDPDPDVKTASITVERYGAGRCAFIAIRD